MYQAPGVLTKLANRLVGWLAGAGLGPRRTVVLDVKGRRSGQTRSTVVNIVNVDGAEYLVAPRGNTEWSRNARANGEALIKRGSSKRSVRLAELPVDQRAPIIQAYLMENALVTKANFGIDPKAPIEEFHRIADQHPVFRIVEEAA